MLMPIAEYLPDLPAYQGGAGEALNVFASSRSYRPFPALAAYSTTPLSGRAQGAFYTRASDGTARQFAGDATKLYLLTSTAWGNVSGGAYACAADDFWDFAQFGPLAIAVDGADTPQKLNVDSASSFSNLGGTPPAGARFIEIMGDFVVMAKFPTAKTRVRWGGINDAESWTISAATQADQQDIPDGGFITGMIGYEYGGLIFQERAIRRMDYEGSPVIFRFKKLAEGIGATIEGSVAGFGDRAFFVHRSGFFMVVGAAELVPIGAEKVDRFFWSDIDTTYLNRVTAAVDPVNKIYGISYVGAGSGSTSPNRLLVFHWDTGRWSRAQPGDHEMIYSGASQQGYTLDSLDGLSGSVDALPFSLDSAVWTGVARPLFAGFNTAHNLGYFNGSNLAATVDTTEAQLVGGQRALLRSLRPMVDGGLPSVSIGTRNSQVDAVSFASAVAINTLGACRGRWRGRYHRARITIPAASSWNHLYGVDEILAVPAGPR
jgi:hypothetical protein